MLRHLENEGLIPMDNKLMHYHMIHIGKTPDAQGTVSDRKQIRTIGERI